MIEFTRAWLPYIYLYGVGGIFFLTGLWLVLRHRSLNIGLRKDRLWLMVLLGGFVWYALMHAVITLVALSGVSNV